MKSFILGKLRLNLPMERVGVYIGSWLDQAVSACSTWVTKESPTQLLEGALGLLLAQTRHPVPYEPLQTSGQRLKSLGRMSPRALSTPQCRDLHTCQACTLGTQSAERETASSLRPSLAPLRGGFRGLQQGYLQGTGQRPSLSGCGIKTE